MTDKMEPEYIQEQEQKDQLQRQFPPQKCTSALKSRLKCSFCPSIFKNYFTLANHLRWDHQADIQIQCKICQKLFVKTMTFHKHLLNHIPGVTKELLDILGDDYVPDRRTRDRKAARERRILKKQEKQKRIAEKGPESTEQTARRKYQKKARVPKSNYLRESQNELKKHSSKSRRTKCEKSNGKNSSEPKLPKSRTTVDEKRKRRKLSCSKCDQTFKNQKEFAIHSVCHVRIDTRINCSKCSNYFMRPQHYFEHSCVPPEIPSGPAPSWEIMPESPDHQPASPMSFQDSAPSPPEFMDHDACPSPCQPSSPKVSQETRPDPSDAGAVRRHDFVPAHPPETLASSPDRQSALLCSEDCSLSPTLRTKSLEENLIESCSMTAEIALQNPIYANSLQKSQNPPLETALQLPSVGPIQVPPDGLLIIEPTLSLFMYMPGKVRGLPENPPVYDISDDESTCDVEVPEPNSPESSCPSEDELSDPELDHEIDQTLYHLDLQESYDCTWCKHKFQFKLEWVDHVLTHKVPTDWLCRQCGDRFENDQHLYTHIRTVHQDRVGARFFQNSVHCAGTKFKPHPFKCNLCPREFTSRYSYNKHRITHPQNRNTLCQYCDQTFPTLIEKKAHMASVHIPKTLPWTSKIICELCGKSMSRSSRKEHMETAHSDTTFMCEDCGKICKNQRMLENHKLTHLPQKPIACKFCSFRCCNSGTKLFHLFNKHLGPDGFHESMNLGPGVETPFKCTECDNEYTTQVALDEHKLYHGERTAHCKLCPWKCFTNYHLRAHVAAFHVPANRIKELNPLFPVPWYCKFCGESTPNRFELCMHESKCPLRSSDTLNNPEPQDLEMESSEHIRKIDKGWHCDLCNKTYKSKPDMRYHYRAVHTGIFRFVCEICGKGMNAKSNLKAHMRQHGGAYECPTCGERFKGRLELEEHKEKEHGLVNIARKLSGKQKIGHVKGQSLKDVKWLEALVHLDGDEGYRIAVEAVNRQ